MTIKLLLLTATILFTACSAPSQTTPTMTTHTSNPYYSRTDTTPITIANSEWKKVLPEEVYYIAREQGTERAFTGKYWDFEGLGTYYCAACGNQLFRSDSKFGSGCGWPSFFDPVRKTAVRYIDDNTHGMVRTEVRCGRCDGHLGHVFDDGPPPTGLRFCMNSIVLDFEPDSK
ncbi:MAG: peptide-methionine (R)-S-oxide reductase MsrB [Flavobacteriales bacterium]|nr:peptide-methionine (R)-S-oxide reductase MsrB [Flavobacteriales bacterium]MBK9287215.1 peptide-methionine (R)-S-oxide reductase MsrB [Flavobacteriales bacterium]